MAGRGVLDGLTSCLAPVWPYRGGLDGLSRSSLKSIRRGCQPCGSECRARVVKKSR
jgi:hypothetical protein